MFEVEHDRYDDIGERTFNIVCQRCTNLEVVVCESLALVVNIEVGKPFSKCLLALRMEARKSVGHTRLLVREEL